MKNYLIVFLFGISFQIYSQKTMVIQGVVHDSLNNPVERASVMIQGKAKNGIISFVYTNAKGFYTLSFKPDSAQYFLSVSALNYEKLTYLILTNESNIIQNVVLKSKEIILNEVVVKAKSQAIRLGEDCTTYKASRFLDGSEKSVEDLLKKLPGMQVAENGKVYFKGKQVEKVYLDGDDLLGSNYTMATRNIDAKLINEVQALENFSTNMLLKGIEKSDKTVLNLNIYEDKKRFAFGNVEVAYGNQDFRKFNLSLFSYLKKIKIYAIANHNNVGAKNNPEGDEIPDLDKYLENESQVTQRQPIIGKDNLFPSNLKQDRINFNEESLASVNSIYTFNKQLKIKTNLAFYHDNNRQSLLSESMYRFNGNSFAISEMNQLQRSPQVATIKMEAEYFVKENAKLKYSIWGQHILNSVQHDLLFKSDSITENLSESLQNNFNFFNQSLNYTYRYPNKKALTIDINHHISNLPQNYIINTDGSRYANFFNTNSRYQTVNQLITNPLNEVNISIKLFGVKNKDKYYFQTGANLSNQKLNTSLNLQSLSDDTIRIPLGYQNIVGLNKNSLFAKVGDTHAMGKLSLSGSLGFHYLSFEINQENQHKNQAFYIEPNLSVLYKFNLITGIRASYQYAQEFSNVNDIASNYWLQGFRSFVKGLPEIVRTNSQTYAFTFSHFDNYNQFTVVSGLHFLKRDNILGSIYSLSNSFDVSARNIIPNNNLLIYSLLVGKYLPFVSSQVRFETNISWNTFTNQINNGQVRENLLINSVYKFTYITTFSSKFNFSLGTTFQNSAFRSRSRDINNEGKNEWGNGFLNLRFKSKQYFLSLNSERFVVDKKSYDFVDATARYIFKNKKVTVETTAKNLLNTKNFQQVFLSDYTSNKLEHSILPRILLIGINYSF